MFRILLIEDNEKDIERIRKALHSVGFAYELTPYMKIEDGERYLREKSPELILLDLEFTLAKKTSIYLIDRISENTPIIVVSHLVHYQRQISLKKNVIGFVPKHKLEDRLVNAIKEAFVSEKKLEKPKEYVFPTSKGSATMAFDIEKILSIDMVRYKVYDVRLHTGETIENVKSVSFSELCMDLKKRNITDLQPISRNQIINCNYIRDVGVEKNGRVSLWLVGRKERYSVGKNYQEEMKEKYLNY